LSVAPPASSLKRLSSLVSEHMPAIVIHDVESDRPYDDYPAMELLYYTDAYEYLLHSHFDVKGAYHPKTMHQLSQDPRGAHRRLVVLWNARFVST